MGGDSVGVFSREEQKIQRMKHDMYVHRRLKDIVIGYIYYRVTTIPYHAVPYHTILYHTIPRQSREAHSIKQRQADDRLQDDIKYNEQVRVAYALGGRAGIGPYTASVTKP